MNQAPQIYSYYDHNITNENIDLDALKIIHRLQSYGHEAYIVGGGVRDLLLNKKPKDFDIATSALPKEIKKLFHNSIIIGKRFKLVHVFFKNRKIIEVATFRASDQAGEDKTENSYGSIETDALRRDLTINSLFYNPSSGNIYDYTSGFEHLQKRKIEIIGDPLQRFEEDPVRMLRTLRHAARTDFNIGPEILKVIREHYLLLESCPKMRIFEEFKKDLPSGYLQEIFGLYQEYDFIQLLLPRLANNLKSNELLKSQLMFCIKGIDRAALEEKLSGTIPCLALLTLFTIKNFDLKHSFTEYFSNQTQIKNFVDKSFSKLAVTKKNKIDITTLLKMYLSLEKACKNQKKFKLSAPHLKKEFKDFLAFQNIHKSKLHLNKKFKFT